MQHAAVLVGWPYCECIHSLYCGLLVCLIKLQMEIYIKAHAEGFCFAPPPTLYLIFILMTFKVTKKQAFFVGGQESRQNLATN